MNILGLISQLIGIKTLRLTVSIRYLKYNKLFVKSCSSLSRESWFVSSFHIVKSIKKFEIYIYIYKSCFIYCYFACLHVYIKVVSFIVTLLAYMIIGTLDQTLFFI